MVRYWIELDYELTVTSGSNAGRPNLPSPQSAYPDNSLVLIDHHFRNLLHCAKNDYLGLGLRALYRRYPHLTDVTADPLYCSMDDGAANGTYTKWAEKVYF